MIKPWRVSSRSAPYAARAGVGRTSAILLAVTAAAAAFHADASRAADVVSERIAGGPRGVVKALHQAAYASDLVAVVSSVRFREGERFRAGDTLIEFDCGRQLQELEALKAVERETRVAIDTNDYLAKRGAGNRNDVELATARHDKARAEAAAMAHKLRACTVKAPFDGSVIELTINPHELPSSQRPFLTIVGTSDLELELIVPSRLLNAVRVSTEFQFVIDETQRAYRARVTRTAGVVDAVSQTLKLYAALIDQDAEIIPGMSGTAQFANRDGR